MNQRPDNDNRVLLIDDEPRVLSTLCRTLRSSDVEVLTAPSGDKAMRIIESTTLAAVLSDQCMPGINGTTLLSNVRRIQPEAIRIMLTGSADLNVALAAVNEGGANHILLKPWSDNAVRSVVLESVDEFSRKAAKRRSEAAALSHRERLRQVNADLSRRIELTAAELTTAHDDMLTALVMALDSRERQSAGHSQRVALYCLYLANRIGIDQGFLENIYRGALLHDIGKIGVPDAVLLKPGPLSPAERKQVEKHVEFGYRVLSRVDCLRNSMCIPLFHHERVDGRGYARGLKGNEIPIEARAFAIIDCYDALRSARPYKPPMSHAAACGIIASDAGTRFDASLVELFMQEAASTWDSLADASERVCSTAEAIDVCRRTAEVAISTPA
ncbi:MAG: response regulator [Phycisphaerales bacterium]|nr:response regulator [Phycisphaerales bacterium]MCB9854080.1 response regulator [Phycisphaerales bacterium]MCB9864390.1 response regulator [Phycisphaerales bacterium]